MNRAQLTAAVADKTGLAKSKADEVVAAVFDIITETLKDGADVRIVGFGTFDVKEKAERFGRNPRTGEQIKIESRKAPAFKAGKGLKDAVNG